MTLYLVYYRRDGKRIATVVTAANLNDILEGLRCGDHQHNCDEKFHSITIKSIKGGV